MSRDEYARIGRAIESMNPMLVQQVLPLTIPERSDIAVIPNMYSRYASLHHDHDQFEGRLSFVAAVLLIFCPYAIHFNCRPAEDNICKTVASAMGFKTPQNLSRYINASRAYLKNPTFRARFERVCSELREVA